MVAWRNHFSAVAPYNSGMRAVAADRQRSAEGRNLDACLVAAVG